MNDLDHKNIDALKYLFKNFTAEVLQTMKSLKISNEKINEFPDFKIFSMFPNIISLSITHCSFPVFPSKLFVSVMPKIEVLNLESCDISSVKTLRPLGELLNLKELNLSNNKIIIGRSAILKSLLFYKNYVVSVPESKKPIESSCKISRLILKTSRPAVVPRPPPFPMLTILSNEVIKEDEIQTILPKIVAKTFSQNQDPSLVKAQQKNRTILIEKEKFGSLRSLTNGNSGKTERNPRVDTLKHLWPSKPQLKQLEKSEESDFSSDNNFESFEAGFSYKQNREETLPNTKEKIQEFLRQNQNVREKALKEVLKKEYTFEEVSVFMLGKIAHETSEVYSVCEVLSMANNVKTTVGVSEHEIYTRLVNDRKKLSIEEIDTYQKILLLDDDIKNLRLKGTYFEWWLKKIEKKHLEYAQHKAILAVHANRIFKNPLLGAKQPVLKEKARRIRIECKNPLNFIKKPGKKINLNEEEAKFVVINFAETFDKNEVKEGETIFIKPIIKFETMIENLQGQLRDKEREFENLSYNDKVLWKLEKIKQNIHDREAVREKLKVLFKQVKKMQRKFLQNESVYFYNMHEKKIDYHEIMKKHDFLRFELPKFIFPLITD